FQADFTNIGNGMPGNTSRQRRKEEKMTPAMGRGADETGNGHFPILQFAQVMSQTNDVDQILGGFVVNQFSDFFRNEVGIGSGRLVSLVTPGFIRRTRLTADKLECLGARLISQRLAL